MRSVSDTFEGDEPVTNPSSHIEDRRVFDRTYKRSTKAISF